MITKTMQGYPWNRIDVANPLRLRLSEALLDVLPHGSGINGSWYINHPKTVENRFYCHNTYEAMNEDGYYCHNYSFSLTIDFISENKRKIGCRYCLGKGYRKVEEIAILRHESMAQTIAFLQTNHLIDYLSEEPIFTCNFCAGNGYTVRHPFELVRLNFRGQREYTCCGYGLKDYLYQMIDESLSMVEETENE